MEQNFFSSSCLSTRPFLGERFFCFVLRWGWGEGCWTLSSGLSCGCIFSGWHSRGRLWLRLFHNLFCSAMTNLFIFYIFFSSFCSSSLPPPFQRRGWKWHLVHLHIVVQSQCVKMSSTAKNSLQDIVTCKIISLVAIPVLLFTVVNTPTCPYFVKKAPTRSCSISMSTPCKMILALRTPIY